MAKSETGGFAFPNPGNQDLGSYPEFGMTLRDYIAVHSEGFDGEATHQYASKITGVPIPAPGSFHANSEFWIKANARLKYMQADAMLAARGGDHE